MLRDEERLLLAADLEAVRERHARRIVRIDLGRPALDPVLLAAGIDPPLHGLARAEIDAQHGDRGLGGQRDPVRRERVEPGHVVEIVRREQAVGQRGVERRQVRREVELALARDALERQLLGLVLARQVDLQQRAGLGDDADRLQEVEVQLELGHAPELRRVIGSRPGIEDELRGGRGDVPELDDLDRARGLEAEALDRRRVGQDEIADLDEHAAANLEQRLVGQPGGVELHPARDLEEEHLAGRRRAAVALERLNEREASGAGHPRIAVDVGPAPGLEADDDEAGVEGASEVVAIGRARGVAVDERGSGVVGVEGDRPAHVGDRDLVAVLQGRGIELDAAGRGVADVDPDAAVAGQHGLHRGGLDRCRAAAVGPVAGVADLDRVADRDTGEARAGELVDERTRGPARHRVPGQQVHRGEDRQLVAVDPVEGRRLAEGDLDHLPERGVVLHDERDALGEGRDRVAGEVEILPAPADEGERDVELRPVDLGEGPVTEGVGRTARAEQHRRLARVHGQRATGDRDGELRRQVEHRSHVEVVGVARHGEGDVEVAALVEGRAVGRRAVDGVDEPRRQLAHREALPGGEVRDPAGVGAGLVEAHRAEPIRVEGQAHLAHGERTGEVVAEHVAAGETRRLQLRRELGRSHRAAQRELGGLVEHRVGVDHVPLGRRQAHVEVAEVDRARRRHRHRAGEGVGLLHSLGVDELVARGEERHRHLARHVTAERPVAEGRDSGVLHEEHRRLRRVELDVAGPRPAERELGEQDDVARQRIRGEHVGDRLDEQRRAGRDGDLDVDEAAVVERLDADPVAVRGIDERRARALELEAQRRVQVFVLTVAEDGGREDDVDVARGRAERELALDVEAEDPAAERQRVLRAVEHRRARPGTAEGELVPGDRAREHGPARRAEELEVDERAVVRHRLVAERIGPGGHRRVGEGPAPVDVVDRDRLRHDHGAARELDVRRHAVAVDLVGHLRIDAAEARGRRGAAGADRLRGEGPRIGHVGEVDHLAVGQRPDDPVAHGRALDEEGHVLGVEHHTAGRDGDLVARVGDRGQVELEARGHGEGHVDEAAGRRVLRLDHRRAGARRGRRLEERPAARREQQDHVLSGDEGPVDPVGERAAGVERRVDQGSGAATWPGQGELRRRVEHRFSIDREAAHREEHVDLRLAREIPEVDGDHAVRRIGLERDDHLVARIGDRVAVEVEPVRRVGEGDVERRGLRQHRRHGVEAGQGPRKRRIGPAPGDELDLDVAGEERALDPVAVGVGRPGEEHRQPRVVEDHRAEAGAAQPELGLGVGDRAAVDREVHRRSDGEGDVDVVAPVDLRDVDVGATHRVDEAHRRPLDAEHERRRLTLSAGRVAPPLVRRVVEGHELDRQVARRVVVGSARELVAEARDPLVGEPAVVVPVALARPLSHDAGLEHEARVRGELDGQGRGLERHARRGAVGQRDLGTGVEDRDVVELVPRRGLEDHVHVLQRGDLVDRPVEHADVDRRAVVGVEVAVAVRVARIERRSHARGRRHDLEAPLAGRRGHGVGRVGVGPGSLDEEHLVAAGLEADAVEVVADRPAVGERGRIGGRHDHRVVRLLDDHDRAARHGDRRGVDRSTVPAHELDVDVRPADERDGRRARRDVVEHPVVADHGTRLVEGQRTGSDTEAEALLEEHDLQRLAATEPAHRPVAEGVGRRVDQDRRLRPVEAHAGRALEHELRRDVRDRRRIEGAGGHAVGRRRERHVDVAAVVQRHEADRAAVARAGELRRGLGRRRLDDGELDLLPVRPAEAHLQAAVQGEQPHLVRNVGQEQHGDLARGHLRQVGVELAADTDVVRGEVQLADDQELAVGAEADDHLAVEHLLRGVDREHLRAAGDQHRRGEGRREAVHRRVLLDRRVLGDDLQPDAGQPLVGRLHRGQPELGAAQGERVVDRGQGLEELDTGGEVRQRETRVRLDQHRDRGVDEEAQGSELRDGEARLDPDPRELEPALDADEEDALGHRRRDVEGVDQPPAGVEAQDTAEQPGLEHAAEQLALDLHGDRLDVGDRELAVEQLAHVDLDARDGAGELQAGDALQARHAGRKRQHEVGRIVLDVGPLDADRVDADRQPRRPLEAAARGRADAEEHPEARLGDEGAVAEEGEVAALAADDERADLHLGPDGAEADQLLVGCRTGVEEQIAPGQREEAPELDAERVELEDEALDRAVLELQLQLQRLGVRDATHLAGLGRQAVADHRVDRAALEEPGAARGDEDRAVEVAEVDAAAEFDLEVGDPDAQVVELEDAAEGDRSAARGHTGEHGRHRLTGHRRRQHAAVAQLGAAQAEAVVEHLQTRNHLHPVVEGLDRAGDAEAREGHGGRADLQQLLRLVLIRRRIVVGVVGELDLLAGDDDDVRDLEAQAGHVEAELARHAERRGEVRGDERDVDRDVELAQHAHELRRHAARHLSRARAHHVLRAAAEVEPDEIGADGHGQDQLAVLEAEPGEADRRALQRQRSDALVVLRRRRRLDRRVDLERGRAPRVRLVGLALPHDVPRVGDELDVDLAIDEGVGEGDAGGGARCQEVAVGRPGNERRGAGDQAVAHDRHAEPVDQRQVRRTRTAEADLAAVDPGHRAAARREEGHVDVALGVQRLGVDDGAAEGARQRRVRGCRELGGSRLERRAEVQEELLALERVERAGHVGERVRLELHLDDPVARVGERALEAIAEDAIGDLLRRAVDRHARGGRAEERDLPRPVQNRALVEADAVDVVEIDVDIAAAVQLGGVDDLAEGRPGQVGADRPLRRRRRRQLRADAEDRETADPHVLELEAFGAADREARRAADAERLLRIAVGVRDAQRDRGRGNVHVELARGKARELDVSADLEDVGRADDDLARRVGLTHLVDAGLEHLEVRAGRVVDDDVRLVTGEVDRLAHRHAGVVDPHAQRAADLQHVLETDQRRMAEGEDGPRVVVRIGDVVQELDSADLRAGDGDADRVRVRGSVLESERTLAEEDVDAARTVDHAARDAVVVGEGPHLELEEVEHAHLGVEDLDLERVGRDVDHDLATRGCDRLVDQGRRGIDLQRELRLDVEAREVPREIAAQHAGHAGGQEDEPALAVAQAELTEIRIVEGHDGDVRRRDADHLARQPTHHQRRQGDLLEDEVPLDLHAGDRDHHVLRREAHERSGLDLEALPLAGLVRGAVAVVVQAVAERARQVELLGDRLVRVVDRHRKLGAEGEGRVGVGHGQGDHGRRELGRHAAIGDHDQAGQAVEADDRGVAEGEEELIEGDLGDLGAVGAGRLLEDHGGAEGDAANREGHAATGLEQTRVEVEVQDVAGVVARGHRQPWRIRADREAGQEIDHRRRQHPRPARAVDLDGDLGRFECHARDADERDLGGHRLQRVIARRIHRIDRLQQR